ncbi:MAG: VIT and vWA domain-containing protein, partial [Victivallaceae bacterium]
MMMKKRTGLYSTEQRPVTLTRINIASVIDGFIAETTITQHFKNTEDINIETVYCFPVENPAAIYSFEIRTGGRVLNGYQDEKRRAYDFYDNALEDGNSAFKLELEEKNILELALGNLATGEEVTVKIGIISHLTITDGIVTLRIPTALTPRYVPDGTSWEDNNIASPPFLTAVSYAVSISVNINIPEISNLRSPSHRIRSEKTADGCVVGLLDLQELPDMDFILEFEPSSMELPQCSVSRHTNGTRAALIKFQPEFDFPLACSKEKSDIIFMLDCSSSMACSYIEPAKEALELCLRSMTAGDYFNIMAFGSNYRLFSGKQVEYNQANLEKYLLKLSEIDADMGGTELLEALDVVYRIPVQENCRREVILLTDGEVYNTREVLQHAKMNHQTTRFYTFGIGRGASQALVKGLADVTGGVWEIISPGENIQEKVLRQFSRLIQPEVKELTVTVSNARFSMPERLPPVYEGDMLTLLAEVESLGNNAEIVVSGKISGETFFWECPVIDLGDDNRIPLLWAVAQITELEEQLYIDEKRESYEREILKQAENFNILCHHSTFLAIQERGEGEKALYYPSFRIVPHMLSRARIYNYSGSFRDLMADVHETRVRPHHAKPSSENYCFDVCGWYRQALKAQDANGSFSSEKVLASKLNVAPEDFEEQLNKSVSANKNIIKRKALITAVTVNLLKSDREAAAVSSRAIKKAERWLELQED